MIKALITGASGFAGSFLAQYLVSQNKYDLFGTFLTEASLANLADIKDQMHLVQVDLTDADKTSEMIASVKPDVVFHLAAFPSPFGSFKNPASFMNNNTTSQVNLLEALRSNDLLIKSKILIVSSAEVYGLVAETDLPIDEETDLKPVNPYGVSKITQDFLGLQYFLAYNLDVIRVRPFNHIGPKLSPDFAVSAFAKKIAEIEKGKREAVLTVGNLDSKRDFTDVRDMVRAYVLLMEKGSKGDVYNIGSGVSYKISDILEKLLALTDMKISVVKDDALFRPNDVVELVCDNTKIKQLTGWKTTIPLEKSLKDTLDYWRNII